MRNNVQKFRGGAGWSELMLLRIVPTALTYRYHVQLRMPARLLSETSGVRNPIYTSLGTLAVLHCLRDGASLGTRGQLRAACETGFTVGLGFGAKAPGSKSYVMPTRIPLQVCVHRCARPHVPCTSCHSTCCLVRPPVSNGSVGVVLTESLLLRTRRAVNTARIV